jgi:hypothetical protein
VRLNPFQTDLEGRGMSDARPQVFYPIFRQKLIWGWVSAFFLLLSILLIIGATVHYNNGGHELILHTRIVSVPLFIFSACFHLRYIFAQFRAEFSDGTLKVVSPSWWGREFDLSTLQSIGCKDPHHHKIYMRVKGRLYVIPNYRSKEGVSVYEILQQHCDRRRTLFNTEVYPDTISIDPFSDQISKDRIVKIVLFGGLLAACSYFAYSVDSLMIFIIVPLFGWYWFSHNGGLLSIVDDDALLISNRKDAYSYDPEYIMGAYDMRSGDPRRTYVVLSNGEILKLNGKNASKITALLDRTLPYEEPSKT